MGVLHAKGKSTLVSNAVCLKFPFLRHTLSSRETVSQFVATIVAYLKDQGSAKLGGSFKARIVAQR